MQQWTCFVIHFPSSNERAALVAAISEFALTECCSICSVYDFGNSNDAGMDSNLVIAFLSQKKRQLWWLCQLGSFG